MEKTKHKIGLYNLYYDSFKIKLVNVKDTRNYTFYEVKNIENDHYHTVIYNKIKDVYTCDCFYYANSKFKYKNTFLCKHIIFILRNYRGLTLKDLIENNHDEVD